MPSWEYGASTSSRAGLGIARNVLAARLESLVEHGILKEVQYQDRPVRFEYVLTCEGLRAVDGTHDAAPMG